MLLFVYSCFYQGRCLPAASRGSFERGRRRLSSCTCAVFLVPPFVFLSRALLARSIARFFRARSWTVFFMDGSLRIFIRLQPSSSLPQGLYFPLVSRACFFRGLRRLLQASKFTLIKHSISPFIKYGFQLWLNVIVFLIETILSNAFTLSARLIQTKFYTSHIFGIPTCRSIPPSEYANFIQ